MKLTEKNGWTFMPEKSLTLSLRRPAPPAMVLPDGRIVEGTYVRTGEEPKEQSRQDYIDGLKKRWGQAGGLKEKKTPASHSSDYDALELNVGDFDILRIFFLIEKKESVFNIIQKVSWNSANLERALNDLESAKKDCRNLIKRAAKNTDARREIFRRVEIQKKYRPLLSFAETKDSFETRVWIPGFEEVPTTSKDGLWRLMVRLHRILVAPPLSITEERRHGPGKKPTPDDAIKLAIQLSKNHYLAWEKISKKRNPQDKDYIQVSKQYGIEARWLEEVTKDERRPSWKVCDSRAGDISNPKLAGSTVKDFRLQFRRERR